jgi:hypothetical protein
MGYTPIIPALKGLKQEDQGQPGPHSESEASTSYVANPVSKKEKVTNCSQHFPEAI